VVLYSVFAKSRSFRRAFVKRFGRRAFCWFCRESVSAEQAQAFRSNIVVCEKTVCFLEYSRGPFHPGEAEARRGRGHEVRP
jgi:hypothetical protein